MKKIVTRNAFPPIPIRDFDWCAYFDGEEESNQYGYGRTEAEAVADLKRLEQELLEANMSDEDFARMFPTAQE